MSSFEMRIGLEVHCELKTRTKLLCSCRNSFGDEPGANSCPVCTGYPGALPSLNKSAVIMAVTAALALNCEPSEMCAWDRKNYFYPDLPKAWQTTQYFMPIAREGEFFLFFRRRKKERRHRAHTAGRGRWQTGAPRRRDDDRLQPVRSASHRNSHPAVVVLSQRGGGRP